MPRLPSTVHRPLCAVLAGVLLVACGDATLRVVFGPDTGPVTLLPDGGIADVDSGPGLLLVDGSIVFPDGAVIPGFCESSGALVKLPQGTCTGDLGKRTFLFASCSCGDTEVSGALRTDSVNSLGAATSGKTASMGANGAFRSNAAIDLGGSIWASSGTPAVSLTDHGTIATEVRSGGSLEIDGTFQVGGDVYATGGITLDTGSLTCGGTLHVGPGTKTSGVTATGGIVTDAGALVPPCNCAKPLDVTAIVQSFATANDDSVLGIDKGILSASTAHNVTLACGKYYFDGMGGDVSLKLLGRTAIFIGGDVSVGSLKLDLDPNAEVDLFVAGGFALNGTFSSNSAAAKVRVYIGGTNVTISGFVGLNGNVYAPNAAMIMSSTFEMTGSLLAKQLQFSGDFTIHYDEAILDAQGCDPPGHTCTTCHDCDGTTPACKGGSCVACQVNDDCCAPLVCRSGKCVVDIR